MTSASFINAVKAARTVVMLLSLWVIVLGTGFYQFLKYEATPAKGGIPLAQWPVDARFARDEGAFNLIMAVHPHCSCSRASLAELAIIMARFPHQVAAHVLFYSPTAKDLNWVRTDLWRTAQEIPGVHVLIDRDGEKAEVFHAMTSGSTLLYDASGRLVFSGGITDSRGHSGDNAGRDAITALLRGDAPEIKGTPVFGCHLFHLQGSQEEEGLYGDI